MAAADESIASAEQDGRLLAALARAELEGLAEDQGLGEVLDGPLFDGHDAAIGSVDAQR